MDFTLDDDEQISIPFDQKFFSQPTITDKVPKRDPMLTCSNYLAGRVPCARPELDLKEEEEEEEEEEAFPVKKKRARTVGGVARCQVDGCEADISELKGYHRRHRVCLRCANASNVMLDGEPNRYCQQCGKFHVLSSFDEGKRSCRRKLERHNNRRRRKPADSRPAAADHDLQPVMQTEDFSCDGEVGKDCDLSSDTNGKRASMDHEDRRVNTFCSTQYTQNINNNSSVSFVASGETRVYGGKDVSNSPSYCDKSVYSSMCQTGRVSFKLYDWNPAEFPRRLRHQIFQWLASMPLELEGYIRPGCTILTSFISMPKFSWMNLHEDPLHYVHDLVAPGKMLSGRGTMLIHLNDRVFRVMEDGTSVMKVEANTQAPRLHYVHPTCFEAGKPMEFFVCGSYLLQPKFRPLVSFSGKYLKYEHCVASTHNWTKDTCISCTLDYQLYKIHVPHTEPNLFGPAFIEMENESGLSNFIPVLIGDKETCSEMKILQQKLDMPFLSKQFQSASVSSICNSCEALALRDTSSSSDLLLDIAWLLKDPTSQNFDRLMTPSQVKRYCHLLNFLICNDSTIILETILPNLMILTENTKANSAVNRISDVDMNPLLKCMHDAREVLRHKSGAAGVHSETKDSEVTQSYSQDNISSVVSREDAKLKALRSSISGDKNETIPLLNWDIIKDVEELRIKSGHRYLARGSLTSRPAILLFVSVAVCLGVCGVLLLPGRADKLAIFL